jgi:hypothetical protein
MPFTCRRRPPLPPPRHCPYYFTPSPFAAEQDIRRHAARACADDYRRRDRAPLYARDIITRHIDIDSTPSLMRTECRATEIISSSARRRYFLFFAFFSIFLTIFPFIIVACRFSLLRPLSR